MTLRLAVIVDKGMVQRFALDALNAVEDVQEIAVFSCTNTRLPKRWLRHAGYYALNLLTVRNRLTHYVPISSGQRALTSEVQFESGWDGAWQVLPPSIVEKLNGGGFDVILKFGMGLLRVPSVEQLSVPILSYHHGDPDRFRGRPAGFWEMAEGQPVMGQVVQVIGNRLDGGKVVAFAETKVLPWSYRATLVEAYRHSPMIINTAIRNATSATYVAKRSDGRNRRLPSNAQVAGFVIRTSANSVRRLLYGAFKEKGWQVSTASLNSDLSQVLAGSEFPSPKDWHIIPAARDYAFYADPFFQDRKAILVEALRRRTGLGEIVRIEGADHRPVIAAEGHISYPSTAVIANREVILPETATWSTPRAYAAAGSDLQQSSTLKIQGGCHVTDPTLCDHGGRVYLFGNDRSLGSNQLSLWTATSLDGDFALHPASPILISPQGARMGGAIVTHDGKLYRFGQDFSRGYGDGLIVFQIDALDPASYSERVVGRIRFSDRHGPHTLNIRENEIVFDWYQDRTTPLAGFRRLAALVRRHMRRPAATQYGTPS